MKARVYGWDPESTADVIDGRAVAGKVPFPDGWGLQAILHGAMNIVSII